MPIHCYQVGSLATNTYLHVNGKNAILIDPADECDEIETLIDKNRYNLKAILLTHGHYDHIGGLPYFYHKYSPKIYCHSNTVPSLKDPSENLSIFMNENFSVNFPIEDWNVEEKELCIGETQIKAYHCPGHTQGDTCYYFAHDNSLFSGDTLFMGSVGRSDLPGGNHRQLIDSLNNLIKKLPSKTKVFPGHGLNTIIDSELKNNPYLKETC